MSSNLTSRKAIKALLNQYLVYPSKGLGQNFLIDKSVLKKIIKAANLTKKDVILEIGPGIGNLTRELARKAKRVIAVEKDPRMCEILKEAMNGCDNVEIIQSDILKLGIQNPNSQCAKKASFSSSASFRYRKTQLPISKQIPNSKFQIPKNYKVVANLPFYIAAPVIRKFLESDFPPKEMVLMVQKEVAQRICAKPPKMNLLAVSVQFYAKPEIINYVSKKSFWPEPKVDSAIIKISPNKKSRRTVLRDFFFKVVKAGFSQPRQMLINNLAKKLEIEKEKIKEVLQKNKISPSQRAETLTVKDWVQIAKEFSTLSLL